METVDFRDLSATNRYDHLGLKANPFPLVGIASVSDPDFPPLASQNARDLHAFVASTYQDHKFGALAIVGEYGFGKTYTLRHLQNRINEGLYNRGADRAVAIYVDSPRPTPADFAFEIVDGFGVESFLKLIWRSLLIPQFEKDFESQGQTFLERLFPGGKPPALFPDYQEDAVRKMLSKSTSSPLLFLDDLLKAPIDRAKTSSYFRQLFSPSIGIGELAESLTNLCSAQNALGLFAEWKDVFDLRLTRILKKYNKETEFVRNFLGILEKGGFRMAYVLVDEFENTLLAPTKVTRRLYCQSLREIFDACNDRLAIIVGVTPLAWFNIANDSPAFTERFSHVIEIQNVSEEELVALIASYLEEVRTASPDAGNPLYPFTLEGIKAVRHKSTENLRVSLEICYILLEHVSSNPADLPISPDLVERTDQIRGSFFEARLTRPD